MVRLFIFSAFILQGLAARSQDIHPGVAKRLLELPGTYVGKLPCADCNGIEASLTLQCDSLCHGGKYMLVDKYLGKKEGDQANKRKGSWQLVLKGDLTEHSLVVIALDEDDPQKVSYYEVKKDGDLLPLDKNQQKTDAPFSLTMKKL